MFGVENFLLFVSAGLLINITPGPDMLYVATRSTLQGRKAGVASALGISAGSLVHIAAAVLGLSAIFMYSAMAYTILKWVGAAYLVYLGIKVLISANQPLTQQDLKRADNWKIFRQAVTVNILNPKVAIFFLAFLPQFTNPETGSVTLQILFLGMVFNLGGTIVNLFVGLFFGSAGNWILGHPLARRIQAWITGSVFVGLGINLAMSDQK